MTPFLQRLIVVVRIALVSFRRRDARRWCGVAVQDRMGTSVGGCSSVVSTGMTAGSSIAGSLRLRRQCRAITWGRILQRGPGATVGGCSSMVVSEDTRVHSSIARLVVKGSGLPCWR